MNFEKVDQNAFENRTNVHAIKSKVLVQTVAAIGKDVTK